MITRCHPNSRSFFHHRIYSLWGKLGTHNSSECSSLRARQRLAKRHDDHPGPAQQQTQPHQRSLLERNRHNQPGRRQRTSHRGPEPPQRQTRQHPSPPRDAGQTDEKQRYARTCAGWGPLTDPTRRNSSKKTRRLFF